MSFFSFSFEWKKNKRLKWQTLKTLLKLVENVNSVALKNISEFPRARWHDQKIASN